MRFKARNNRGSKVVLRVKNSKGVIIKKGFNNYNGSKEICLPKATEDCMTAILNVPIGKGGYYQLIYNGEYVTNQRMIQKSPNHLYLRCNS